jgi:hypothetical protein
MEEVSLFRLIPKFRSLLVPLTSAFPLLVCGEVGVESVWPQTWILLISASQVARITGISHQYASLFFF